MPRMKEKAPEKNWSSGALPSTYPLTMITYVPPPVT